MKGCRKRRKKRPKSVIFGKWSIIKSRLIKRKFAQLNASKINALTVAYNQSDNINR